MTKISRIEKDSLIERTVFELFHSDQHKEYFLKLQYPILINLNVGDSVNVIAESGSRVERILGQNELPHPSGTVARSSTEYIVRNSGSKGIVDMALRVGGEITLVERHYVLVKIKPSCY